MMDTMLAQTPFKCMIRAIIAFYTLSVEERGPLLLSRPATQKPIATLSMI